MEISVAYIDIAHTDQTNKCSAKYVKEKFICVYQWTINASGEQVTTVLVVKTCINKS